MTTRRALYGRAMAAVIVMTSCSGGSSPSSDTALIGDDIGVDELEETLSTLGGESVDDTSLTFDDTTNTLNVGGLAITWDRLDESLVDFDKSVYISPTWPTLAIINLVPPELFGFGAAVLSQQELVTDADTRQQLIDDAFRIRNPSPDEVIHTEMLHTSITTGDDGRTCFLDVRAGQEPTFLPEERAALVIAGPGIASSGFVFSVIDSSSGEIPALELAAEVVEMVCGRRPEGL